MNKNIHRSQHSSRKRRQGPTLIEDGYRCIGGRLHSTEQEADDCDFHPEDKHFDFLPPYLPLRKTRKEVETISASDIDPGHDHPVARPDSPVTVPSPSLVRATLLLPLTPQRSQRAVYPTPVTQRQVQVDIGDMNGDIESLSDGRSSLATPSTRDISRNSHGSTVQVPETPLIDDQRSAVRGITVGDNEPHAADLLTQLQTAREAVRQSIDDALAVDPVFGATVREEMNNNAGLIDRLRTRNIVEIGKNQAKDEEIRYVREERDVACVAAEVARAKASDARRWSRVGCTAAGAMVTVFFLYVAWCWYNSAEFAYVRKRQFERFGMDSRDY